MKAKDLFKFSDNNIEVRGIVITIMDSFDNGNHWYVKYLCYAQNTLFTIHENGINYPEDEEGQEYTVTSYYMGETLANNTVIPEFDSILNDINNMRYINLN